MSNEPRSIEQTVELVNALPRPLSLPCFVESLGRPLRLHATLSEFSAQPALGARSPRIFIYLEPLILSVVPAGLGAALLELGEQREGYRSLKGELLFPIAEHVEPAEPYEHVLFTAELTACAFCHASEVLEPLAPGGRGYVSQSLRPRDGLSVPLGELRAELEACDAEGEPARCGLLDALFSWGETPDWDFPTDMATFGE